MLIGRTEEQQVLTRLVAGARLGTSGVAVLRGEPGIGKSTLLAYAVELAENMNVLRAVGSAAEQAVAFAGLHQLLRPIIDRIPDLPMPQAEALSVALAIRSGPRSDRFAVGAGALTLVTRYAEDRPILIVVDDLHRLDRPSADAIAFVARRLVADRIGVVLATRPEDESPAAGLPVIELGGLDMAATGRLLAAAGVPLSDEVAARVRADSGGNPLALLEIGRDEDLLDRMSRQLPLAIPQRLQEAFGHRLDRLDDASRSALLLTAVADGDLAVVHRAASGLGVDASMLASAELHGLVTIVSGRATFRHPLVAGCVYARATSEARRRMHRAVADALPRADTDRRAWHRAEATLGVDDAVADDLVEAGDRARGRGAYAVAATSLERAAQMSTDDAARAERLIAAGECAWLAGLPERAERLLAEALTTTGSVRAAGVVTGLRGSIAMQVGSLTDARRMLFEAGELLRSCDPDAAVHAYADLIHACFHLADTSAGLEAARRIDGILWDVRSDRVRLRGRLTIGIARVVAGEPGIDQIRAAVSELTEVPDEIDDPLRPDWTVLGPLFLREADTGRAIVDHVFGEVRSRCALGQLPRLLFHVSRVQATTARWQEALAGYHEGIDLARETGLTTDLTTCLAGLAWLQARMGREQECRDSAAEALRLADAHDIHLATAWSRFALGELALALGRPGEAVAQLTAVNDLLTTTGFLDVDLAPGPELVEAFVRLGEMATATRLASDYCARADAKGQPWACARAQRALGLVDAPEGNESHFERALTLHGESPDDYEEGRTRLLWGAVLRRGRHRVGARPHLRAALSTFERLGAVPWAEQAATELAATGEAVVRAGGRALDALTPQELRISQLLAAGRTTREAATELFLSPKTVEYHLRHVYTKLNIHSRPELVDALGGS